jgi:hypothetical protein
MGYDLHITRESETTESQPAPIRLDEWQAYVASDDEFRMVNFAEVTTPRGDTIRYDNEGLALWTAYSGGGTKRSTVWFDYRNGRIVVKNPDDEVLDKMKKIARVLGARVVGDEGEEY